MPSVTIRPMQAADIHLMVGWLQQPHVAKWFHEHPATLEAVTEKYLPRIQGHTPTKMFVSAVGGKAIGMVQIYKVDSYPEYAMALGNPNQAVAIDLFIGDPEQIGRGIGPQVLRVTAKQLIPKIFANTKLVVSSPSINNPASIRAFIKAGFAEGSIITIPGEADPEQVVSFSLAN